MSGFGIRNFINGISNAIYIALAILLTSCAVPKPVIIVVPQPEGPSICCDQRDPNRPWIT